MGDADIALRHIARSRAAELVRPFLPEHEPVEVLGWIDSQTTMIERRLDKALRLRVGGEPRVLHVEFCLELRADLPYRVYDYVGLLVAALRAEGPHAPDPLVESVAVVLSGRRRPLPTRGVYRTSWSKRPFGGVRYRIDAVYQRTVAELCARGSLFWLALTRSPGTRRPLQCRGW